ncbi:LOW QUALITY PROTEIN: hypothetical protein OSB04_006071 [Centaurea solstitialis]|uniref:25S rRNA (uridine-N(3))-methyltransferase BMT5-like domain-containing protein n=1 Tax=Centaurea solstitialis TaxID=347529 RepID=A0AA38TV19_9ASTR|nr:LOW QUALITY PROTEIN: hypothetical protein OSB04_006071 [Centaurea solstitialis]
MAANSIPMAVAFELQPPTKVVFRNRIVMIHRVKSYSSNQHILLVGKGDFSLGIVLQNNYPHFSFSLSLATSFQSGENMVPTTIDSYHDAIVKHKKAQGNLELLKQLGSQVFHGVDATTMAANFSLCRQMYDRIIFNYPTPSTAESLKYDHVKRVTPEARSWVPRQCNQDVVAMYREGSRDAPDPIPVQRMGGHQNRLPMWFGDCRDFNFGDYPGYTNKRGGRSKPDKPFPLELSKTFEFLPLGISFRMLSFKKTKVGFRNKIVRIHRVKSYSSNQHILLVGDGDFSFSLSLAISFQSSENMVPTTIRSYRNLSMHLFQNPASINDAIVKHKKAQGNLELLKQLGAQAPPPPPTPSSLLPQSHDRAGLPNDVEDRSPKSHDLPKPKSEDAEVSMPKFDDSPKSPKSPKSREVEEAIEAAIRGSTIHDSDTKSPKSPKSCEAEEAIEVAIRSSTIHDSDTNFPPLFDSSKVSAKNHDSTVDTAPSFVGGGDRTGACPSVFVDDDDSGLDLLFEEGEKAMAALTEADKADYTAVVDNYEFS